MIRRQSEIVGLGDFMNEEATHWVVNNTNYEAAAWTCRDILTVCELFARNLEAIAARTWVVEHSLRFVPSHVLNFDLVVIGTHGVLVFKSLCKNQPESESESNSLPPPKKGLGHGNLGHNDRLILTPKPQLSTFHERD